MGSAESPGGTECDSELLLRVLWAISGQMTKHVL